MSLRGRVFVAGAVVVALLIGVAAVYWKHEERKPPDFVPHPNEFRVHVPPGTGSTNPTYPPTMTVDGEAVYVATAGVTSGTHPRAQLYLRVGWPPPDTGHLPSVNGDYAVGDHLRVADIDVTVLAMWHEPDEANDAVDVRIVRLDHHTGSQHR